MITIWNQKEVYVGHSQEEFNVVREKLASNNIRFKYRMFQKNSAHMFDSRSAASDLFGRRKNQADGFFIYVHKRDYDKAKAVLL
jgi:hypothetical protein